MLRKTDADAGLAASGAGNGIPPAPETRDWPLMERPESVGSLPDTGYAYLRDTKLERNRKFHEYVIDPSRFGCALALTGLHSIEKFRIEGQALTFGEMSVIKVRN